MQSRSAETNNDGRNSRFLEVYKSTAAKKEVQPLSDNDLLILAFEAISRTYTHEEKNYRA